MGVRVRSICALAIALIALAPTAARAVEDDISISIESGDWITSANAEVVEADTRDLVVKVLAPRPQGDGHFVWQRCSYGQPGPGTYECGFDKRSAQSYEGVWIAKAFLGGSLQAQRRFRI
jgi:hypothetical protein